jgi:hypothetical protein
MSPETPDKKEEYRKKLADVLNTVRKFDGTEGSYQQSMRKMIGLEQWMVEVFAEGKGIQAIKENEKAIVKEMGAGADRTIPGLLALMKKRLTKVLSRVKMDMVVTELDGVILPPGDVPIVEGRGKKVEPKEVRFQERLQKLLLLLSANGIFLDDVIVCTGAITTTMMRRESYYLIEIPRLNKEILLNEQVGEATFVIDGILSRDQITHYTKEELQKRYGDRVIRIIFQNNTTWGEQVIATLNLRAGMGEKVDVSFQERLREEVRKLIPTPKEWAEMNVRESNSFKVVGIKITQLARIFGIKVGRAGTLKFHFDLGKRIFGEDNVFKQLELNDEELIEAIKILVPTPEKWAKMKVNERAAFKVARMGIVALARRFGVRGNPFMYIKYHFELGEKIYGKNKVFIYVEKVELNNKDLIKAVRIIVTTPKKWVSMKPKERAKFRVKGIGLQAIGTRLGVIVKGPSCKKSFLELGERIYGKNKLFEQVELTNKELREEIRRVVITPEVWAKMKAKQKKVFKVKGMGLRKLATKFGVKGNPAANHKYHHELGSKIFGKKYGFEKNELGFDALREEVKKIVKTPKGWAEMKAKQKISLKVTGLSLIKLARRFGINKVNPINNHKYHLELGRKIYGENPVFDKK